MVAKSSTQNSSTNGQIICQFPQVNGVNVNKECSPRTYSEGYLLKTKCNTETLKELSCTEFHNRLYNILFG